MERVSFTTSWLTLSALVAGHEGNSVIQGVQHCPAVADDHALDLSAE